MPGKQRYSKFSKWPPPFAWIQAKSRFQSFSPLINRIVHHALLKSAHVSTSRCRNSRVSRIGTWYRPTRFCIMPQMQYLTGFRSGMLAGHMSGPMNWGVSQRRSSTVSRVRCDGALSWQIANTSPAMLRVAYSSSCVSNTSR